MMAASVSFHPGTSKGVDSSMTRPWMDATSRSFVQARGWGGTAGSVGGKRGLGGRGRGGRGGPARGGGGRPQTSFGRRPVRGAGRRSRPAARVFGVGG